MRPTEIVLTFVENRWVVTISVTAIAKNSHGRYANRAHNMMPKRIKNIVDRGLAPRKWLALNFTEKEQDEVKIGDLMAMLEETGTLKSLEDLGLV